jgi:hypothetical protein
MEKLFIKILLLLFTCQVAVAQDSLCVFKVKGIVTRSTQKPVLKGRMINKTETVVISTNSELIAIDGQGNLYLVDKPGKYNFKALLSFKRNDNRTGLTASYFKFIWSELTHHKVKASANAVVFRGDILMQYPQNNAIVYENKVDFIWSETPQKRYYLFLKNSTSGVISKFETNGTQLGFTKDNAILIGDTDFEWAVTTDASPNLDNMPFYKFSLSESKEYQDLKTNQNILIEQLRQLGLNESEISETVCNSFGACSR